MCVYLVLKALNNFVFLTNAHGDLVFEFLVLLLKLFQLYPHLYTHNTAHTHTYTPLYINTSLSLNLSLSFSLSPHTHTYPEAFV